MKYILSILVLLSFMSCKKTSEDSPYLPKLSGRWLLIEEKNIQTNQQIQKPLSLPRDPEIRFLFSTNNTGNFRGFAVVNNYNLPLDTLMLKKEVNQFSLRKEKDNTITFLTSEVMLSEVFEPLWGRVFIEVLGL